MRCGVWGGGACADRMQGGTLLDIARERKIETEGEKTLRPTQDPHWALGVCLQWVLTCIYGPTAIGGGGLRMSEVTPGCF